MYSGHAIQDGNPQKGSKYLCSHRPKVDVMWRIKL